MTSQAPLIVVDDDDHEKELIQYLLETSDQPFLILCDINMPRISGIELRNRINSDEYLRRKAIPFVFLSTGASKSQLDTAYDLISQGFFEKGKTFEKFKERIETIVSYWRDCQHPDSF